MPAAGPGLLRAGRVQDERAAEGEAGPHQADQVRRRPALLRLLLLPGRHHAVRRRCRAVSIFINLYVLMNINVVDH